MKETCKGGVKGETGNKEGIEGKQTYKSVQKLGIWGQNQNYLRVVENRCYSSIISRNH